MIMSPSMAKLAVTPPVVGWVITLIYRSPAASCLDIASEVLAICIRENIPSCILAPPDVVKIIRGSLFSVAYSIIRVIFSPTAEHILPIIKLLSITAVATLIELISPVPVITASFNPDLILFNSNLSSYPSKFKGFLVSTSLNSSTNVFLSNICSILIFAEILK